MKTAAQQKGFTLIELLVVIGILAILFSIVLIAINPARQFNQANDTKRRSDTLQILNSIHQYAAEHSGNLPTGLTTPLTAVDVANTGADICTLLMPTYISALPQDPENNNGVPITSCTTYDTGYQVAVDADGRVTVSAPNAKLGTVSVTR
jgi:prepilin-type N-terminal cleavage/methylation domain-containing protein